MAQSIRKAECRVTRQGTIWQLQPLPRGYRWMLPVSPSLLCPGVLGLPKPLVKVRVRPDPGPTT